MAGRFGVVLLVLSLAGCTEVSPEPPPPCPVANGDVWVDAADLSAVGPQTVNATWVLEGDLGEVFVDLALRFPDGGTLVEAPTRRVSKRTALESWTMPVEAQARLIASVRLTCGGRVVASGEAPRHVFEQKTLERSVPRFCGVLQPIGSDRLDCSGEVIDLDGGLVPGWRDAALSVAAGSARWTLSSAPAELGLETGPGTLSTIPVAPFEGWTAAETFIVLDSTRLVEAVDGGLVEGALDAGLDQYPEAQPLVVCAAAARGERKYVGLCQAPAQPDGNALPTWVAFLRCALVRGADGVHGVGTCERHTGYRVSSDSRTGRVALLEGEVLSWIDLATGEVLQTFDARGLRFSGAGDVGGLRGFLSASLRSSSVLSIAGSENTNQRGQVIDLRSPRVVVFSPDGRPHTTADLAWIPGQQTTWTWLREP